MSGTHCVVNKYKCTLSPMFCDNIHCMYSGSNIYNCCMLRKWILLSLAISLLVHHIASLRPCLRGHWCWCDWVLPNLIVMSFDWHMHTWCYRKSARKQGLCVYTKQKTHLIITIRASYFLLSWNKLIHVVWFDVVTLETALFCILFVEQKCN